MARERAQLPSGSGGLLRYFDDYKSNVEITPEMVILICGVVILIELFFRVSGGSLF